MVHTTSRRWLITGASRGLGRSFAEAALASGDTVVATARNPGPLADDLSARYGDRAIVLELDVTDMAQVAAVVTEAIDRAGHLDVVVNNAGYGLAGGIEECTHEQIRAQMETNFFGPLQVTRCVLPHFRSRRAGHIIQISSVAAFFPGPNLGIYSASKAALEAASESLAGEVAPFGIKVTIVEPGGFRTDWGGGSMDIASPMPEYDAALATRRESFGGDWSNQAGDPVLAAEVLLQVVASDDPPVRLPLGGMAYSLATMAFTRRLEALDDEWVERSRATDSPLKS